MAMNFSTMKSATMGRWAMAAAAAALLSVLLAGVGSEVEAQEGRAFVFPFKQVWSLPPAVYSTMAYNLGGLTPEWDETNSTWYVREAGDGDAAAKYQILQMTATKQFLLYVSEGDPVAFVNVESGRALSWREEGEGEYFLVEEEVDSIANISTIFQFSYGRSQACVRLYICTLYNVLDYSSSESDDSAGLAPYEEDGVTYFTRASSNLTALPLLIPEDTKLKSSSFATAVLGQPFFRVRPRTKLS